MAKILEEFPRTKAGRVAIYPWKEWLDGYPRLLVQGEDFSVTLPNLRANAFQAAKRHGVKLRTSRVDASSLAIQAYIV
jgi:hypothetical protein